MSLEAQREITAALRRNTTAAIGVMEAEGLPERITILAALAEQEARLMDELRACWSTDNKIICAGWES